MRHELLAKTLAPLAALALVLPLAAGCGQREAGPGPTTIHFVTWKPNVPEAWEEIYRLFREEHPEITVVTEVGPHSSTAFHDLLTQKLKNRSADADVFLMDVVWPPEFGAAGWARPLDDVFPAAERDAFLPGAILAGTYGGATYGMPLFVDSGVLYYRTDLLAKHGLEPPATWEELERQARLVAAAESAGGAEIWGYSGQFKQYEGLVCDMQEFILSNRGAILEPDTDRVALADPAAVAAVRFVRDRVIGQIAPRGALTYQEPESLDLFLQGKAVFLRNWPYAWKVAGDPERSRVAGRVGIARLPHFAGGESASTLGGWQVGVAAHSAHPEAAVTFAKFLAGPRVQKVLALRGGRAPTRAALYDDPEVLAVNPQFADLKGVFLTARPRPRSPLYPAISNALQRYFSGAISGAAPDLERAAADAAAEIERIVAMTR
jgi:multiple sugar transport system substrate-binding protein